jgi:cell division protease FtsH
MVMEFGMSPRLGPLSYGRDGFRNPPMFPGERQEFSEETARVIDEEVSRLLNESHDQAKVILERDRDLLDRLSEVLIEREVLEGSVLRKYADGEVPIPTKEELRRESEAKRGSNGHEDTEQVTTGPDLLASAPGSWAHTQEIPTRPD